MSFLELHAEPAEINALFDDIDIDGSGSISMSELLRGIDMLDMGASANSPVREAIRAHRHIAQDTLAAGDDMLTADSALSVAVEIESDDEDAAAAAAAAHPELANDFVVGDEEEFDMEDVGSAMASRTSTGAVTAQRNWLRDRLESADAENAPSARASARFSRQLDSLGKGVTETTKAAVQKIGLRPLIRSATLKKELRRKAAEDLDKSVLWILKYFVVFPLLARMARFDHCARCIFPVAYLLTTFVMMGAVDFGRTPLTGATADDFPCA